MNNKMIYIAGFTIIALMCIGALAMGAFQDDPPDFAGADDGAEEVVNKVDPGYDSWWSGIFGDYKLPDETESLLFALQAAIGAIIIGFFIGRVTKKA